MPKGYFKCVGGEQLTRISASWFVSYMYYIKVDKTHFNWQKVCSCSSRISICDSNIAYHKVWMNKIVGMNPNRLGTNKLGIKGTDIISMAKILLPLL